MLRAVAAAALLMWGTLAHAGLFDDEEARKAILDLRNRVTQVDDQARARHADLVVANAKFAEQLAEQVQVLRRSLLELSSQLEAIRGEMAKLRGADESVMRELAEVQRRQKDMVAPFEERLRRLEPVKASVDGQEVLVDAAEKRAFEDAVAVMRTGDFDKATVALSLFARRYGSGPFADTARFWLGNAQYGKRDYKEAIATFRALVASNPEHPRAPEALLAVANSQAEMKDRPAARKTLDELMKAYPKTEAAAAAKERLAALK